jgi:membrane fusion protein, multidrug efflux system
VKRQTGLILLAASLLWGCGSPGAGELSPKAIHVRVVAAVARDFTVRLRVSGRIAPPVDRQASVSASVAGRVLEVTAREGQPVKQGEVLARIDARLLGDGVRSGEAALKRVQADSAFKHEVARRSRELFEKGVASRQDAESDESGAVAADASVVEATSNVETARRNRGFADVTAPFDGVVVRVLRHPGELVDGTSATAIAEVAGLHPLEVMLDAPSEALAKLRAGDSAEVVLASGKTLTASVARIAGALDAASLVGGVRLRFTGSDPALVLGSPVEVALTLERLKDAVSVPKRAVRRGPEGGAEVVLAADGKAKVTPVVTGPEDGDSIVIREGLKLGQVVVVEDPLGLADGTALEVER